jgi:signal transduction histidine kinase
MDRKELAARALRPELPLNLRIFRRADGLRSEEFTATLQPTAARAADGRMWFATGNGLVTAAPKSAPSSRRPPLVNLERVAVEGASAVRQLTGLRGDRRLNALPPAAELGHIPAPAGQRRAVFAPHGFELLHVPPQQERLDFQFVSPSFVAPLAVTYRYRLSGFDREWVEAGGRRAAYYTQVPPGRYRFEVEARNDVGVWSQPAAALNLIVESAWWEQLPVRGGVGVTFLGAGVVFYQVRVRKLRRQREQSAQFSRQLIRSQEQERARIAGELHDGLGQELQLIRNHAEIALRQASPDPDVARQLTSISETAARAIEGVRALSRGLRPPELDQLGLTQALRWLGKNQAESIEQKLDFRVEELDGALSSELEVDFYRVAQEALNNAVKHSGASEITFEALWTEAGLQLSVFDNGRGFNREEVEANPRSGSGLKNMQARSALLRGTLEWHSEPGVGTRLTLLVPVPDKRRAIP